VRYRYLRHVEYTACTGFASVDPHTSSDAPVVTYFATGENQEAVAKSNEDTISNMVLRRGTLAPRFASNHANPKNIVDALVIKELMFVES